jgi:glutamine amidotransferase
MQLLFDSSEEGDVDCLGLLPGGCAAFRIARTAVPHMGWNNLEITSPSPLLNHFSENDYVYYVHSYCAPVGDDTLATTTYGERFSAVVQRENVFGVQCHPERSAKSGALLLKNFLSIE